VVSLVAALAVGFFLPSLPLASVPLDLWPGFLVAAAFALFKIGAVPIIIDPGMGRKSFLACIARSKPRVLLGIPLAQVMSRLFRSAFASVGCRVWVSGSATARETRKSEISNFKF